MQLSTVAYHKLGRVPVGIGAVLTGWDIPEGYLRHPEKLAIVDFRAMGPECPHDCIHCFTDKSRKSLTLLEILRTIDQIADLGAWGINYLGEGEPTIDPDFFSIIRYTSLRKCVVPVIFTDAATMMRDRDFSKRVFDVGASVVVKMDSLFDAEYQNWVVGDKTGTYFDARNEALEVLMELGFNAPREDGATHLGFDMVTSARNIASALDTLRFARDRNIWVVFAFYVMAGRSGSADFDQSMMPTREQKLALREGVRAVDKAEYGFDHYAWNNYITTACHERLQIYGNGDVSVCPGNETLLGNIREDSLSEMNRRLLERFPQHRWETFDGNCPYREQ